ncbi:MAG: hypothetical protein H0W27_04645 [Actinobacteria bacterium]|nr:hypothetical protein [Actinomycetota bacterium]
MALTRQVNAAAKEAQRAQLAFERSQALEEKERKRLYTESRIAEAALKNEQLQHYVTQLETVLEGTLDRDDYLEFEDLKAPLLGKPFQAQDLPAPELPPALILPEEPSRIVRLRRGWRERHAEEVLAARTQHAAAAEAWERREQERIALLASAEKEHERAQQDLNREIARQHREVDEIHAGFEADDPSAVVWYFSEVLRASSYPEGFPQQFKMAFVPESKQLVIEYALPPYELIPEVASRRYVKAKDEIFSTSRPMTQRKALYASLVSQVSLRTIHELFEAARLGKLETVVFNGYVETVDKATGRRMSSPVED